MKAVLPSGKEIWLGVFHTNDEVLVDGEETVTCDLENLTLSVEKTLYQGTRVRINVDDLYMEARSVCKPPDKFIKRMGRRTAQKRLWEIPAFQQSFDRNDRQAIFNLIFPEYKAKNPTRGQEKEGENRGGKIMKQILEKQADGTFYCYQETEKAFKRNEPLTRKNCMTKLEPKVLAEECNLDSMPLGSYIVFDLKS